MSGWLFDGAEEINRRLERGQSFGLSKDQSRLDQPGASI